MGRPRQQPDAPPASAPPPRPRVATDVARLLSARAFQVGPLPAQQLARLTTNLQTYGGEVDPAAAAWIGEGVAPADCPSVSLSDELGTLGPRSFGFLNNVDGVAPLLAPLPSRPRRGGVALVVPRREALPELGPLLLRRRLGVSWLISVGDGDPAEVMRFLSVDPATTGILLCLGRGLRAVNLHEALGPKPTALLDLQGGAGQQGLLCRAVARRAEAPVLTGLEEWLAHGALMDASAHAPAGKRPRTAIVVLGGGADFVATEAGRARLPAPVTVESGEDEQIAAALAQASVDSDFIVLCGDPEETALLTAARPLLRVDPAQPDRLRALLQAVGQRPRGAAEAKPIPVKPDNDKLRQFLTDLPPPLYENGRMVQDEVLSDHDTKRLLHAYGARVSRQAPANTVTAVLRVAGRIGLPVTLHGGKEAVVCTTQADLKRQATLLLSRLPHIMVREVVPDAPRRRLQVVKERGLGALLRLGDEAALVPLLRGEARDLADEQPALSDLLGQVSALAQEQPVTLDLDVYVGDPPLVVQAAGTLTRPR